MVSVFEICTDVLNSIIHILIISEYFFMILDGLPTEKPCPRFNFAGAHDIHFHNGAYNGRKNANAG